jgi:hypothetical protein
LSTKVPVLERLSVIAFVLEMTPLSTRVPPLDCVKVCVSPAPAFSTSGASIVLVPLPIPELIAPDAPVPVEFNDNLTAGPLLVRSHPAVVKFNPPIAVLVVTFGCQRNVVAFGTPEEFENVPMSVELGRLPPQLAGELKSLATFAQFTTAVTASIPLLRAPAVVVSLTEAGADAAAVADASALATASEENTGVEVW